MKSDCIRNKVDLEKEIWQETVVREAVRLCLVHIENHTNDFFWFVVNVTMILPHLFCLSSMLHGYLMVTINHVESSWTIT